MIRSATAFALIASFGTSLVVATVGACQDTDGLEGVPLKSFVPEEPVRIPFEIVNGRPVVEATIDGQGPFPFIFDTGAGAMFLHRDFAETVGLERKGEMNVGIPGGPQTMAVDLHVIDRLELGDAVFETLGGMSHDDPMMRQGLDEVNGVIGLPTFADCLVTLDYRSNELVIARGALVEGDGSFAYEVDEAEVPSIPLDIAGTVVPSHLDTGSAGSITIPARYETVVPLGTPVRVLGRGRTASGEFEVRGATLDGVVTLGGQRIEHPEIRFNDMFAYGNIGGALLRNFVVTIDQTNQRIRFAPAGGPIRIAGPTSSRKSYGIMLAMSPTGTIPVRGTVPGSVAERAGVEAGDTILAINGRPVDELDMAARSAAFRASPITLTVERGGETLDIEMAHDDPSG